MFKNRWVAVLFVAYLFIGFGAAYAADSADTAGQTLHIDIPVKLAKASVVLNIDHLAVMGDMPFAIGHMALFANHTQRLEYQRENYRRLSLGCGSCDAR